LGNILLNKNKFANCNLATGAHHSISEALLRHSAGCDKAYWQSNHNIFLSLSNKYV